MLAAAVDSGATVAGTCASASLIVIENINPSLTVGTEELNNQRAATTMHK
jgi:hypothetical protein